MQSAQSFVSYFLPISAQVENLKRSLLKRVERESDDIYQIYNGIK